MKYKKYNKVNIFANRALKGVTGTSPKYMRDRKVITKMVKATFENTPR